MEQCVQLDRDVNPFLDVAGISGMKFSSCDATSCNDLTIGSA